MRRRQRGLHPSFGSSRTLRNALQLMRSERQARWKVLVPKTVARSAVCTLSLAGEQPTSVGLRTHPYVHRTTVEEVDVDAMESCDAFERSSSFHHIPRCTFPHEP